MCFKIFACGIMGMYAGSGLFVCGMLASWLYWDSPTNIFVPPKVWSYPVGIIWIMKWITAFFGSFIYSFYYWLLFLNKKFWYYMYSIGILTACIAIILSIPTIVLCIVYEESKKWPKRIIATISMCIHFNI